MDIPFIIDGHLDLSMNAMEWNRDLREDIELINRRERGMTDKPDRGLATVSLNELRKGNIGLVVATQIARYVTSYSKLPGWNSPSQAWAHTQGQLAWYREMEHCRQMTLVLDHNTLENHIKAWSEAESTATLPIGFVLSLEGADSLITIGHLEHAYYYGLRAIGPAHYGEGRYANGTDSRGRLNNMGLNMLKKMDELRMILDVSHLNDDAFYHALEVFPGAVWASHGNCRALVNHNRQMSDDMIRELIDRQSVIGVALDAWMLVEGWKRGVSTPQGTKCTLELVANHIDHICQLAGNTKHVAIGSDLDGAFGREQCPTDITTVADLQKLFPILARRGYSQADITAIAGGNWLEFLRKVL